MTVSQLLFNFVITQRRCRTSKLYIPLTENNTEPTQKLPFGDEINNTRTKSDDTGTLLSQNIPR
jgi:hypothetical protein